MSSNSGIRPLKQPKTFDVRKMKAQQITANRWLKNFHRWDCKNHDGLARSGRFKSLDFEAVLQAIEENPMSSTWRVSGELGISVIHQVFKFDKSICMFRIVSHVTKILQNFSSTVVLLLFYFLESFSHQR